MINRRLFLTSSLSALALYGARGWAEELELLGEGDELSVKDALPTLAQVCRDEYSLPESRLGLLQQVYHRVDRVKRTVGYGNFNLLGFDEMLAIARNYSQVGEFSTEELAFIEEMFEADASRYGFYGEKVFSSMTRSIPANEVEKIPHTGHYLYRGQPMAVYERIKKDVGAENIILTSGVRSIVKQLHLFLAKAVRTNGNLSVASRSLAPPGYSYHGVGDFDVGKVGYGARNFSEDFAHTDEYRKLIELGYISIRYPHGNRDGVRFEPWHIKVV